MRRYLITALFFGTACGASNLKVEVSEGEVPSDDTASVDTADPEDDRDTDDEGDEDDWDDEDEDEDEDDWDDEDEDEDEVEDEDEDEMSGVYSGSFSVGPLNIPPFCEGEMEGRLAPNGTWSSEGECTINAGPGAGVELTFYVEGSFSGTDLTGTTYMVEGNQKMSLDTEGTYSTQRETVMLEWSGTVTNPQGDTLEVVGDAVLYAD